MWEVAETLGALRLEEVWDYLAELEYLCADAGLDFAILAAQSALETDNWRSAAWVERLNPAGIGIRDVADVSIPYQNGRAAARAHVVHMIAYVYGAKMPALAADIVRDYRVLDPRYAAVFDAGWAGTVKTINDLSGKWASVADYAERICARSLAIWPTNTADKAEEVLPVAKPRGLNS